MAFSADGTFLATASEQGTVIRVHTIPQASKVFTFRRGTYPATIYSLSFGPQSQYPPLLAATSSSGTVHVFMLAPTTRQNDKKIPGIIAAVIPELVTDMVESEHHFITIHDGFMPGTRSICAVAKSTNGSGETSSSASRLDRPRIFVVTTSGYYNQYSLQVGPGRKGTFTLERECTLLTSASDQILARFVE
ncbi:hypothetical protein O6H91_06G142400 [Diphasiastrum complanatum]|uniref:Uncharacterized protein n=1 Tax=Diphasiastrum complanatum TaxID=34168 RepID=A0ACC2DJN2_DIPCM|nr:hypothetical protein O6H91_06G142400 [Diphasiastrum complanatum]